jgi:hypothetical protein
MRIVFGLFWYTILIGISIYYHSYAATGALMVFAFIYFRRQLSR